MTLGSLHGEPEYAAGNEAGPPAPSFPPAATTTAGGLCAWAYSTALCSALLGPPPKLRLTTFAPWSTAQMTPLATSLENPLPSAQSTCTGRIFVPGAAPEIPVL